MDSRRRLYVRYNRGLYATDEIIHETCKIFVIRHTNVLIESVALGNRMDRLEYRAQ